MGTGNRFDGIDDYAANLIKKKARQLVGKYGFTRSDREDLEQELVLDLLGRLSRFDQNRAERDAFINYVVKHKIATIIEKRTAEKRDYRRCPCSLNERVQGDDGESVERGDMIDQYEYLRRTGESRRQPEEVCDMSIDMQEFLENLPHKHRDLCERLMTESIAETARHTNTPRSTVYESIKDLRVLFEGRGLKKYL